MPSRGLRSKGFCSENHPIEPPRDVFTYTSFLPRCISILTSPSENHPIEPPRDVFTYTSFLPRCISILTSPFKDRRYLPLQTLTIPKGFA